MNEVKSDESGVAKRSVFNRFVMFFDRICWKVRRKFLVKNSPNIVKFVERMHKERQELPSHFKKDNV